LIITSAFASGGVICRPAATKEGTRARPVYLQTNILGLSIRYGGTLLDSTAVVERIWGKWADDHDLNPVSLIPMVQGIRAIDVLKRLNLPGIDPAKEALRFEAQEMEDVEGIIPVAGAIRLLNSLPPKQWAIVTSAPIDPARRQRMAHKQTQPNHRRRWIRRSAL